MQKRMVTIRNRAGIHCRPSGAILNAIRQEFPDHAFRLATGDQEIVKLDSMLDLISLGLARGRTVELQAEGPDENEAIRRIGDLFEHEFDFPPRKE